MSIIIPIYRSANVSNYLNVFDVLNCILFFLSLFAPDHSPIRGYALHFSKGKKKKRRRRLKKDLEVSSEREAIGFVL